MERLLAAGVVVLLAAGPAAGTILVNPDGSGDYPTIQAALDVISSSLGDTILLGDGVFTGPGNSALEAGQNNLYIRSVSGDPSACLIDAQGVRLFSSMPSEGTNAVISAISFPNCGGVGASWARYEFHNCRFTFTTGGAYAFFGSLYFYDCSFTDCLVPPVGAGEAGGVLCSGCSFIDNHASFGSPNIGFHDCLFRGNDSGDDPLFEAHYNQTIYGAGASFHGCRFEDNHAPALIRFDDADPHDWEPPIQLTLEDCVFWRNEGTIAELTDVYPNIHGCTFAENYGAGSDLISMDCVACFGDGSAMGNNIFAFRDEGMLLNLAPGMTPPTITCSDFFQVPTGWFVPVNSVFEDPRFCDLTAGTLTLFDDSPCLPANNSCTVQMGAEGQGCEGVTAVDDTPSPPALLTAHPNPFNPKTRLSFSLPAAADVRLAVYALDGRRVATVLDGQRLAAGPHALDWEARDASGHPLASGVYLLALDASGTRATMKLTLLR